MVSVLVLSAVDQGLESRYEYKSGIVCFATKRAAWMRKSKDWLAQNLDNVSEWGDMFNRSVFSAS
jgi:hypothetical protein